MIGEQNAGGTSHPVSPDLLGITKKRESGWLVRWLIEPDKVLAGKDPLALELLAKYNNLPMPNMRLDAKDARALLDYIDAESNRIDHAQHHHHSHEHQHGAGMEGVAH